MTGMRIVVDEVVLLGMDVDVPTSGHVMNVCEEVGEKRRSAAVKKNWRWMKAIMVRFRERSRKEDISIAMELIQRLGNNELK
jgi:hypothetical protein